MDNPPKDKGYALRVPMQLFEQLTNAAAEQNVSVNELINLILMEGVGYRYEVVVKRTGHTQSRVPRAVAAAEGPAAHERDSNERRAGP